MPKWSTAVADVEQLTNREQNILEIYHNNGEASPWDQHSEAWLALRGQRDDGQVRAIGLHVYSVSLAY